jgi:hypothetical protein
MSFASAGARQVVSSVNSYYRDVGLAPGTGESGGFGRGAGCRIHGWSVSGAAWVTAGPPVVTRVPGSPSRPAAPCIPVTGSSSPATGRTSTVVICSGGCTPATGPVGEAVQLVWQVDEASIGERAHLGIGMAGLSISHRAGPPATAGYDGWCSTTASRPAIHPPPTPIRSRGNNSRGSASAPRDRYESSKTHGAEPALVFGTRSPTPMAPVRFWWGHQAVEGAPGCPARR